MCPQYQAVQRMQLYTKFKANSTKIQNRIINRAQEYNERGEKQHKYEQMDTQQKHIAREKGVTVLLVVGELMEFLDVREETEVR